MKTKTNKDIDSQTELFIAYQEGYSLEQIFAIGFLIACVAGTILSFIW